MKKRACVVTVLISCLCFAANAQLRVLQNGRVQAGTLKLDNEDLENVTTLQIFGPYGDMRSGSKLTFGDFGRYANQGWNVFLGEYGSDDTDQLWLHGKRGIYLTTNGYANNIVGYYNPAVNTNFVFNTNLRVNGINITSDARLKENVQALQHPLSLISQLNGVSYNYNLSEIKSYREQDDSKFSAASANKQSAATSGISTSSDAASSEKASKDKQIQAQIDRKEAEEASRKRIGFLAQDIQKVLPELVLTDEKGIMSIDYIGFIPLIVESIKEMQHTIQTQNEQIETLLQLLSPEAKNRFLSEPSSGEMTLLDGAKLYNREGAAVSYRLPDACNTACLQIFDIAGRMIKQIDLDKKGTNVEIHRSEIGYGTFIYTLFVDGQKADTLKKYISM